MLLSDVLIQEGSQMAGLVLKQRAGPGCEEAEPSYQLPLHQGQAGKLGVVDEALPAEDGVINAATKQWQKRHTLQDSHHLLDLGLFTNEQQVVTHKKGEQVLVLGILQEGLQDLVGEDLHQDLVFPQLVPHKKLVLCTQSHVLADSYHSVVSENSCYLSTEEPDEACLLLWGAGRRWQALWVDSRFWGDILSHSHQLLPVKVHHTTVAGNSLGAPANNLEGGQTPWVGEQ